MYTLKKRLAFSSLLVLLFVGVSFAQTNNKATNDKTVIFRFQPGENKLIFTDQNERELGRLYNLLEQYQDAIRTGEIQICVDSYCSSQSNRRDNVSLAFVRACRIKWELIEPKGVNMDYVDLRYFSAEHEGMQDVVRVRLYIKKEAEFVPEKIRIVSSRSRS